MHNSKITPFSIMLDFLLIMTLLLTGCGQPTGEPPVPTEPLAGTQPIEGNTPLPTAPPARLLLVDTAGTASAELTAYLTSFAAENGLLLETSASSELPPQQEDTKVVIFLAEPANLADIVAASPATQFIVSGSVDMAGLTNLSVISAKAEDLAFMGGYLTILIAWDWRAGGLIPNDIVMAAEKADAFMNGARYVCGQCTPYYAPIVYFPLLAQESSQAGTDAWGTQITTLGQHFVNSYYVDPSVTTPELLDSLVGLEAAINNDVNLVGLTGTSSPERFTALLGVDALPALQQLLPQVLAGGGGTSIAAQVKIVSITDDTFITPAKVDNFNRVAADLAAGIIVPLSIP
jgi:hypothetical protein